MSQWPPGRAPICLNYFVSSLIIYHVILSNLLLLNKV